MAIKLKLHLPVPQSALLLKTILFGGSLGFAKAEGLGFFPIALFLAVALIVYLRPAFRPFQFAASWCALVILSLGMAAIFSRALLWVPAIIISSLLFAVLVGVKDMHLVYRREWHCVLHLAFAYELFALLFLREELRSSPLLLLGVFALLLFLLLEYLTVNERGMVATPSLRASVAGALSLLTLEMLWAVRLLPLGFINAANAVFIFFFVAHGITIRAFEKTLTRKSLFTLVSLFVVLFCLVLFTSHWSI